MVDVKVNIDEYPAFPTMIYKFDSDLGSDIHSHMISYIKAKNEMQTEDDLQKMSAFRPLAETIQHTMADILKKLEYEYQKIEITGMWGNRLLKNMTHPPHSHSNNLWSGVYYIKSSKGASPIQFFDPRAQAHQLRPRNNPNWKNSGMLQFDAIVGTGLIFPSWLQHWVPPTQSERLSVSWNVLLRGEYGDAGTFQNAYI